MDLLERDKLKKAYIKKYKKIYADICGDNKKVDELIVRLADLSVLLDECREHLSVEGAVTSMDQGSYSIDRENPWSKVADAKTKTYLAVMNKLDDMMPSAKESAVNKASESLATFISKGKPIELR